MILINLVVSFFSMALAAGPVIVPVPNEQAVNLKLVGMKGGGQSDHFMLCEIKLRPNGSPVAGSQGTCQKGRLNKPVSVWPGTYLVKYSETVQYVTLMTAGDFELPLQKIEVPKVNGKVHFDVFVDMTSPEMQAGHLMGLAAEEFYFKFRAASNRSWALKHALPFLDTGDVALMSAELKTVAFDPYGKFCNFDSEGGRLGCKYVMVTDPKDGDFVSVLPGVYGIRWRFPNGRIQYQYGVTVP